MRPAGRPFARRSRRDDPGAGRSRDAGGPCRRLPGTNVRKIRFTKIAYFHNRPRYSRANSRGGGYFDHLCRLFGQNKTFSVSPIIHGFAKGFSRGGAAPLRPAPPRRCSGAIPFRCSAPSARKRKGPGRSRSLVEAYADRCGPRGEDYFQSSCCSRFSLSSSSSDGRGVR